MHAIEVKRIMLPGDEAFEYLIVNIALLVPFFGPAFEVVAARKPISNVFSPAIKRALELPPRLPRDYPEIPYDPVGFHLTVSNDNQD